MNSKYLREVYRPPLPCILTGVNYGLGKTRFVSPVHVGKWIRMRVTLKALREGDGFVQSTLGCTLEVRRVRGE